MLCLGSKNEVSKPADGEGFDLTKLCLGSKNEVSKPTLTQAKVAAWLCLGSKNEVSKPRAAGPVTKAESGWAFPLEAPVQPVGHG